MTWDAVIFDLFGTLTEPVPELWANLAVETAAALGADAMAIRRASDATMHERMRGDAGDAWQATAAIAKLAEVSVDSAAVDRAVRARLAVLRPVSITNEAFQVLKAMRGRILVAVLSNCIPETSILWPSMGIDDLVDIHALSCETRLLKPEQASFRYVLDRLGVDPTHVLYVTDGDHAELLGAECAGLTPVQLTVHAHRSAHSPVRGIGRLSEILGFIEEPSVD